MRSLSLKTVSRSRIVLLLLLIQIVSLVFIFLQARTDALWFWATFSFIPPTLVCLFEKKKGLVILSIVILFITQQAIFVSANSSWGFTYGSDAINDFQTASLISETSHFELGKLGYSSRLSYSFYPMVHLLSAVLSEISALPLAIVAVYVVPFLNAILTAFALFFLNHDLFGLDGPARNIATLFFEMGFYYTAFQSQFIRETLAFPLVLLALVALVKLSKSRNQMYAPLIFTFVIAVVFAHQISSYLFLVILALMALAFTVFQRNKVLNNYLVFSAVVLGAYTSFVTLSFSATEWSFALEGIQAILLREGSQSILRSSSTTMVYVSYLYYAILAVCVLIGGLNLIQQKRKDRALIVIVGFFVAIFIVSVLLRLSTSADPWSWTYYMGLRGTIWAFIGISVAATIGVIAVFRLKKIRWRNAVLVLALVCVLAIGKFSQYPALITSSSNTPLTYDRYVASLWLKGVTVHGSSLLVAPDNVDINAFEASREMAPYAYLKEYFLDESTGHVYDKFSGYIPFIGGYYDQYENRTLVDVIYSNGNTELGQTT
jgi:hypothetical protein